MDLNNRFTIITGASRGFGLEVAKKFIEEGAYVMLSARQTETLLQAQEKLRAKLSEKNHHKVEICAADVTRPDQMEQLVQTTLKKWGKLDVLVANAGIYGTKGPIEEVDWDEWSYTIDINLKGVVLQCRAVLPYLKTKGSGKIIILSGGGATKPMPNLSAYAASKAGVVRFAETLAEEVKTFNIDVNSLAPGALNTGMLDEIIAAGAEKVGANYYAKCLEQKANGGTSLALGAALCTFLASTDSDGITGRLISAVWDPWKTFPQYIDEIKKSDVYTLRRVIPEDRNLAWSSCS